MMVSMNMGLDSECDKSQAAETFLFIESKETTDFWLRIAHQQLIYNTGTEKAGSVSYEKSLFGFLDAKRKNKKKGYSLPKKSNFILKLVSSTDIGTINL
jgi:hypothetical protein